MLTKSAARTCYHNVSLIVLLDMIHFNKEWLKWPIIRVHLCTIAVAFGWNATWRMPREAFRYGALGYGILFTVAMVTVSLPLTLLQLAVGQLSQQDAVGVWRAVPFFKGVGYLRMVISFISSTYTILLMSLNVAYFVYTLTHGIPFPDCVDIRLDSIEEEEYYENVLNATECLKTTFMSPLSEGAEYYLSVALIALVLWILASCVFYTPIKIMKKIFYVLPILILIPAIVILSIIGDKKYLSNFLNNENWVNFGRPYIWQSATLQALWSTQISGGYLISAGDSIYSNTNVKWSSVAIVATSIITSWFWLIFWFSLSSEVAETGVAAVLLQIYQVALVDQQNVVWPLLIMLLLIFSGIISLLVLLYPIFDRLRRVGGLRWRVSGFAVSVVGAAVSTALLAGGLPLLEAVEDVAVPLLVFTATLFEILIFGFIYGWRNLIEDVEFLTGSELAKYWVWGWWVSPAIIVPVIGWWTSDIFVTVTDWSSQPWQAPSFVAAALFAVIILIVFACVTVAKQVQYDIPGKLRSSFSPSRHWGPRDPITHYYWLARREDPERSQPRTRYNRRELGQLSSRPSFLTSDSTPSFDPHKRSNSDDWLYTFGRKESLSIIYGSSYPLDTKERSKSLDWDVPNRKQLKLDLSTDNNAVVGRYKKNVDSK